MGLKQKTMKTYPKEGNYRNYYNRSCFSLVNEKCRPLNVGSSQTNLRRHQYRIIRRSTNRRTLYRVTRFDAVFNSIEDRYRSDFRKYLRK